MKRSLTIAATAAVAMLALSSCAPQTESGGGGGSDTIVLYTGETASSPTVAAKYEEATGVTVQVVNGSSGELFSRVQSEAGNPQGDVYWVPGILPSQNPDLFELYESPEFEFINPEYISDIEPSPVSGFLNAVMYNSDLVAGSDVPTSYQDLADPKWRGQIYMADPVQSSSAYGSIMAIYEAGGWDLVEDIARNIVISDNFAGPRAISDGEAALGLFNEPAAAAYLDNPNVEFAYPSEGVTGGWASIFLIAGGPNPEGAQDFVDWFLSEEGQTVVAEDLPGLRPSRIDAPAPSDLPAIDDITVIPGPDDMISHKDEYLDKWEEIVTSI
jgi:iron(III) transport system substrate-binding protein